MELPKASFDVTNPAKKSILPFERFSALILNALLFLLPIFLASTPLFSFQFSKSFLVSVCVIGALVFFLLYVLKTGNISFPFHFITLSLLVILATTFVSSLVSASPVASLVGDGFEMGTFSFLALLTVLFLLVSILFKSKEKIFYAYLAFFASFLILSLFHTLRFFLGADFLSFGLFNNFFSNTVGKANELAVFFGIGTILSLVSLELVELNRLFKALLWFAFGASVFLLVLINFSMIWLVLALFAVLFFVYVLSWGGSSSSHRKISWPSITLLVISLFFLLAGGVVGTLVSKQVGVSNFEVRPSWSATSEIINQTLKSSPVFGVGPNNFASQWLLFKPNGVNLTSFWNVNFSYGIGLIPSMLVTGGIVGFLAWVVFIGFFLYLGFRSIFSKVTDHFSQYLVTSSFLVALYLWVVAIFYVPGITIFALTFFFTALFIAALGEQGALSFKSISLSENPRVGFTSILIIVFLLIGTVSFGYLVVRSGLASYYFESSVVAFNNGDLNTAEKQMLQAVAIEPNDGYYRSMSQLSVSRLERIITQTTDTPTETMQADFQRVLGAALQNAVEAVNRANNDYQNWFQVGQVYEVMTSLGIDGAYQNAVTAYNQAQARNPKDPSLNLAFARLELAKNDRQKAREYITQALIQKQNYTEAIFLLSQIEVSEGNLSAAISSVESAALLAPNDPLVYFRLGLLKYNRKDYKGSAEAFERAVSLNSVYANAKYFLGLSYYELSRRSDAIQQFKDIQQTNPENGEVKLILDNLTSGRAPFSNAAPPVDDKPEKREKLPIKEE